MRLNFFCIFFSIIRLGTNVPTYNLYKVGFNISISPFNYIYIYPWLTPTTCLRMPWNIFVVKNKKDKYLLVKKLSARVAEIYPRGFQSNLIQFL